MNLSSSLTEIKKMFSESDNKNIPAQPIINTNSGIDFNQLGVVMSGIRDGVVVLDTNKNIVFLNQSAIKLIGTEASGIIGHQFNQLLKLYDKNKEIVDEIYSGLTMANLRMTLAVQATPPKESFVNLTATKLPEGINMGWVITMHDVCIEHGVEEMRMGFVSIAAHELRTPITSIKGYLEAFMDDYRDKLNDDQKGLLDHIKDNAERLAALVENLLNVSRVERGTMSLNSEGVDWDKLVKDMVEDLHERAAEKNIQLTFTRATQTLPNIKVDKVRIAEVLSNLIGNAINYTNPNGIVTVSVEQKDNEIITHITDSGIGIPQDAIQHLFTKFFRVTQGLTQQQYSQGNGLGLYISKAIIDMHHGKIWVNSEIGKGSVFSFSIPIS